MPLELLSQLLGVGLLLLSHHLISQGLILKEQALMELIPVFHTLEAPSLKREPGVEADPWGVTVAPLAESVP